MELPVTGNIMLLAQGAHSAGHRLHVPQVTLLILVGALGGHRKSGCGVQTKAAGVSRKRRTRT